MIEQHKAALDLHEKAVNWLNFRGKAPKELPTDITMRLDTFAMTASKKANDASVALGLELVVPEQTGEDDDFNSCWGNLSHHHEKTANRHHRIARDLARQ